MRSHSRIFGYLNPTAHQEPYSAFIRGNRGWAGVWLVVAVCCGCNSDREVPFRFNRLEWVRQERLNLKEDENFDDAYRLEIGNLLTALFGTPNEPHFPYLEAKRRNAAKLVINMDNLRMAAGPVKSDRQGTAAGLYRKHCVQCHGISGDGLGPTAPFLNPYPRDFRLGKFKFKSTPLRRPPTNEDLAEVIRRGIPGTGMPSFRNLQPSEIESLVDYVKYLSIRGQLERRLIAEIDNMDGDPLLNLQLATSSGPEASEDRDSFEEQLRTIAEEFLLDDIVGRWARADKDVIVVPDYPESFLSGHPGHLTLIEEGRQLFRGKANCVQCHGLTGLGDGQNENYDDWTNDWLKTPGVDPNFRDSYQHFLDVGVLRPRYISPRNLQLAVFRGGNRPQDIYRRIAHGIEGTPMPSAPTLTSEEVWALVAFVREMRPASIQSAATVAGVQ